MRYQKQVSTGAWAKASELKNGTKAKIVSEVSKQPSTFLNDDGSAKTQDVAKVRFENLSEPLNLALNRTTINGLIDAFGEDSVTWQGHYLTVETEKVRVAGKAVTAIYLIPEGYEKVDDSNGYAVILKMGNVTASAPIRDEDIPVINISDDEKVDLKDIPF